MPYNRNREGTVYIPTRNPDTVNYTPNYAPGELGVYYEFNQNAYQIVQLDSGATSATPTGVVAANELAFWKDKANYIVTNDVRLAMGGQGANSAFRNFVAGVFRVAATAGNIVHVLQKGNSIAVKSDGNGAIGDTAVADTSTTTARVTAVTAGTAATCNPLGTIRGASSGGNINVDLNIPSVT